MKPLMVVCQNCSKQWFAGDLPPIKDIYERHNPGDIVADGECPDCGALCYPVEAELTSVERVREAIRLLREARELLKAAGAVRALERVRAALKSADGAQRHAEHEQQHREEQ